MQRRGSQSAGCSDAKNAGKDRVLCRSFMTGDGVRIIATPVVCDQPAGAPRHDAPLLYASGSRPKVNRRDHWHPGVIKPCSAGEAMRGIVRFFMPDKPWRRRSVRQWQMPRRHSRSKPVHAQMLHGGPVDCLARRLSPGGNCRAVRAHRHLCRIPEFSGLVDGRR